MHHPKPPLPTTTTTTPYLIGTATFSVLFLLYLSLSPSPPPSPPPSDPFLFPTSRPHHRLLFLSSPTTPPPPSLAYLISGASSSQILRLLLALYHPKNHYLLHLDLSAPHPHRHSLALLLQSLPLFRAARNVDVIGKADFTYPQGSSSVSALLHGASVLLKINNNWDWFINLSANDYPLVTQDDLLHILSYLPKDMNFVNHTSYIGWRESRKLKPIIVDPGLYLSEESAMFYATQRRDLPDAYRLFTGSASGIFSRKLIEFCISGTENFARTLLMYLSNTRSAQSVYFPTLICNSKQFNRTIINRSLHYSAFDTRLEPRPLNSTDFADLIQSGAAFASPFLQDDPVLDRIDQEILGRVSGKPTPGGWCLGESGNDTCSEWGDAEVLRPGPGARKLEKGIVELLSNGAFLSRQCVSE